MQVTGMDPLFEITEHREMREVRNCPYQTQDPYGWGVNDLGTLPGRTRYTYINCQTVRYKSLTMDAEMI